MTTNEKACRRNGFFAYVKETTTALAKECGIIYFISVASEKDRAADAFVVAMKSAYERGYRARADEDYAREKALLAEQQAE